MPTPIITWIRRSETPSARAPISPSVSASSARPVASRTPAPTRIGGTAIRTSTMLRSVSEPMSQLAISDVAHGLGESVRASATPAAAMALRITPARRKLTASPAGAAIAISSATPIAAPAMAKAGSTQGEAAPMLRNRVRTAPSAAMEETPSTPGSAKGLLV